MHFKYGTKQWFDERFSHITAKIGDRWGHRWRGSQKYRYRQMIGFIQKQIVQEDNQKILDIGCALADFTDKLYNLNHNNQITGIDISDLAVQSCKQKYPYIKFAQNSLPDFNPDSAEYDGIVAAEVINYLSEQDRDLSFKNIKNSLRAGGWFFFTTHLDKTEKYFTAEGALEKIKSQFEIGQVDYNYAFLFTKIERPLLKFIENQKVIEEISAKTIVEGEASSKIKFANKIITMPVLGKVVVKLYVMISFILRTFLKIEFFPRLIGDISKKMIKLRILQSHIFILAFKKIS